MISSSRYYRILKRNWLKYWNYGSYWSWLKDNLCLIILVVIAFFSILALLKLTEPYPLRGWMDLRTALKDMGVIGPVIFILLMSVLPLVSPISIFIITGSASFGPVAGMIFSYIGALVNANLTFYLVKTLSIEEMWGRTERTARVKETIRKNGLRLVLLFQMFSVIPFVAINSAAAASGVHWKDFMAATLVGVIPAIVINSFVGEAIVSRFFPPDVYFAFISLVLLLIIFTVLRKRNIHFRRKGVH